MNNPNTINNLHIKQIQPLISPEALKKKYPPSEITKKLVRESRETIKKILKREDRRLLAIVGPCSIHDPKAALEYAKKLKILADEVANKIVIVMRVYFEKPRTTTGWKGLINDPHLNGSFDIETGLKQARKLMI